MNSSTMSRVGVPAPVHRPDGTPAKWQLAALSFAGLYPLVTLASWAATAWLPWLSLPARTLVMVAVVVPTMTYVVTPALQRLANPWLHCARHAARP
ncbi:hypothetical protein [Saccharopolyspora sp. 5N708]|uniref:hypothetical protein n=1 Tax=Saccharopolyspora sp. 5N708 TaxID=3457424 RepID=UPI003FD6422B